MTIYPFLPYLILFGYLCSRISPSDTKPTPTVGDGQLHLVNCLFCPQNHVHSGAPPITLAETPFNWVESGLPALHAHTKYSGSAAVSSCQLWPKPANSYSLCPCRSHKNTTMSTPSCTPGVHILVHRVSLCRCRNNTCTCKNTTIGTPSCTPGVHTLVHGVSYVHAE